ncbi:MAG: peptide ABC transporter substrate-binding protein [Dehalococcoidia bacterium]|nr:peptide ABC transporter substrate-binding protein [Dehalococcoidia bacterium]
MSNRTLTLLMGAVAFLILAVAAVFGIVLLGGGGDDDGTDSASPDATRTPRSSSSSSGICQGKSLIVPGNEPASVFDPIQVTDVSTSEYVVEIFGGLVTINRDLEVEGDLAESWDISPDGKTYTFKLRNNILFHDDTRVTAHDVKYSIERAADPKNASPTVRAYLGNIAGVNDKFTNKSGEVSGVKVVDDRTLTITLIEPSDFFLEELTYPVSYVVQQEQVEGDARNWTRKPIGTGPFKVAEYKVAEVIRLTKNDRYHLGAPKLDEVVFELGGGSISTRYENDEIHIGFVPAVDLDAIKGGNSPLSAEYKAIPNMATSYIQLNTKVAPFDDPKVRQAFAMTIDREQINEVLLYGYYQVADGFLPPDMPGYKESVSSYDFDPVRAKQLLSESKYATNMPRITMSYGGSTGDTPDILVAMQEGWKEALGIEVQLQVLDSAAYLREQRTGKFQMSADGWSADYPDPENFLGKLFGGNSPLNYTGYKNDQVDALLEQARTESSREKRYELYTQAEQIFMDDAAIIPTFWPVDHLLVKPCVVDYPAASMTIPKYRYIDIKED